MNSEYCQFIYWSLTPLGLDKACISRGRLSRPSDKLTGGEGGRGGGTCLRCSTWLWWVDPLCNATHKHLYCKLLIDTYTKFFQVIHPWNRSHRLLSLLYVLSSNTPLEQVCFWPSLTSSSLPLAMDTFGLLVKWGSKWHWGVRHRWNGFRVKVWVWECVAHCGYFGWYRWSLPRFKVT